MKSFGRRNPIGPLADSNEFDIEDSKSDGGVSVTNTIANFFEDEKNEVIEELQKTVQLQKTKIADLESVSLAKHKKDQDEILRLKSIIDKIQDSDAAVTSQDDLRGRINKLKKEKVLV